jgi:hypothetical protein
MKCNHIDFCTLHTIYSHILAIMAHLWILKSPVNKYSSLRLRSKFWINTKEPKNINFDICFRAASLILFHVIIINKLILYRYYLPKFHLLCFLLPKMQSVSASKKSRLHNILGFEDLVLSKLYKIWISLVFFKFLRVNRPFDVLQYIFSFFYWFCRWWGHQQRQKKKINLELDLRNQSENTRYFFVLCF